VHVRDADSVLEAVRLGTAVRCGCLQRRTARRAVGPGTSHRVHGARVRDTRLTASAWAESMELRIDACIAASCRRDSQRTIEAKHAHDNFRNAWAFIYIHQNSSRCCRADARVSMVFQARSEPGSHPGTPARHGRGAVRAVLDRCRASGYYRLPCGVARPRRGWRQQRGASGLELRAHSGRTSAALDVPLHDGLRGAQRIGDILGEE